MLEVSGKSGKKSQGEKPTFGEESRFALRGGSRGGIGAKVGEETAAGMHQARR